jgi:two-component system, OmpR family, response regulator BaeR
MTHKMVLIVEDEQKLARLLADYLKQSHYQTHCISHGDEVIDWVTAHHPSVILLDLTLPGKDGLTLCREIRQFSKIPILMVTARVDEIDRLLGLELGADDYICKPFSPREVVARVKAVLRRTVDNPPGAAMALTLDDNRFQATFHNQTMEFTHIEYQLLKLLASEPGRIFSRDQLMSTMYNDHRVVSDRTIDSHIKKIRKTFNRLFPDKQFIHSVYSVGYRFEIGEEEQPVHYQTAPSH